LASLGHVVTIVTATAGEGGATRLDAVETARLRREEAAAAAALIGADYRCAGLPDLAVFNDDASRRIITEAVRRAAPDLVVTGSLSDYHPDHEATAALVRDACFAASVPNYRTGEAAVLGAIPHLYFMDPIGGRGRDGARAAADFGVDVEATFETKRAMLACHASQMSWVSRQHGVADHLASMEAWTRRRGADFRSSFAEGFRQYRGHPYPRGPLLQELVGEMLREG
jgi:LmbE family N-acetylglucosaminyl deacetylase